MGNYYPPLGFHFLVEFGDEKDQSQFQSVSGLTVDIETEEITEGGENRFKHKLPVRARYPNLVLKRGLATNSKLLEWCQKASEGFEFEPADLVIKLLNQENEPLLSWNVVNAYPVKWAVSEFDAEESRIVIETIEMTYSYFKTL